MKRILGLLALFAFVVACASFASVTVVPPGPKLSLAREARIQANEAWLTGSVMRQEGALCVNPRDFSIGRADGVTVQIRKFTPAVIAYADSISVGGPPGRPLCPPTWPMLHTHLDLADSEHVTWLPRVPSSADSMYLREVRAPFCLVISGVNEFLVFGPAVGHWPDMAAVRKVRQYSDTTRRCQCINFIAKQDTTWWECRCPRGVEPR